MDSPLKSLLQGRFLVVLIGVIALLFGLTDESQGMLLDTVKGFINDSGVFVASIIAFYSKAKEILRNKKI